MNVLRINLALFSIEEKNKNSLKQYHNRQHVQQI